MKCGIIDGVYLMKIREIRFLGFNYKTSGPVSMVSVFGMILYKRVGNVRWICGVAIAPNKYDE